MKLLILGATGDVGSSVLKEALDRGHTITACARNISLLSETDKQFQTISLDISEDTETLHQLVTDHDVIISALRPPSGKEAELVKMTNTVLRQATIADKPVYITGGAATLKIDDTTDHTVLSAPGFLPENIRPIAEACAAQDKLLNEFPDTLWTYLRPPAMLLQEGRSGRYALGRDILVTTPEGQSQISYADFAVAMLDLIELQPAPGQRLTVGW